MQRLLIATRAWQRGQDFPESVLEFRLRQEMLASHLILQELDKNLIQPSIQAVTSLLQVLHCNDA